MNDNHEKRASQEELVAVARTCRERIELPPGYTVAIIVTDQHFDWVGVSCSGNPQMTQVMIESALVGSEKVVMGETPDHVIKDSDFEALRVIASKVAAGYLAEDIAEDMVGEICTRFGPSAVRAMDDYYEARLAEFRKSAP
jgi:hypothetical protein